jgi:hypothetical protein
VSRELSTALVTGANMSGNDKPRDTQDEDEELKIFQAIESSRNQMHEDKMRTQRENVVASRSMQAQPSKQSWQAQQQQLKQPHNDAKASKPAVYVPKGIPASMIISQPQPEEGGSLLCAPRAICHPCG